MKRRDGFAFAAFLVACLLPGAASAQIDARMFRYPDVSATHIAFVYGGDIWTVSKSGGVAVRLSSPAGEESFPRFSPDGARIAFTGNYDGNDDVYVVPAMGGDPVRLTYHPGGDRVQGWHPDGKRVVFTSSRESGRQRYSQFYMVADKGGLPEKMTIPYGEFGSFSPDGREFAYLVTSQDFRTWKRYRGGDNSRIWLFDLGSMKAQPMVPSPANSTQPMFHGDRIYFASDRGADERMNLWVWDRKTNDIRQVTTFTEDDISFPAIGPSDIVFQAGGTLYLMDLATEKVSPVKIQVVTDQASLKPRIQKVQDLITNGGISPTGKRAYFEARGDVFSVPAEHGPVVNLTRSSGVAERYPSWSPDGKTLTYFSDRSGEYELTVRPADGLGAEKTLTKLGPGFRYNPTWSPDSKKIAYYDDGGRLWVAVVATGQVTKVAESPQWLSHGPLQGATVSWSADSRWMAYAFQVTNGNYAIYLHDATTGKATQVTSAYFSDTRPTFDPEGKFLYYLSNRQFNPVYGDFDNSWTYPNSTRLVAVPLRRDVKSPLAARNDTEGDAKKDDAKKGDENKGEEKKGEETKDEAKDGKPADSKQAAGDKKADDTKAAEKKNAAPAPVLVDLDGFEARAIVLPPKAGNYTNLAAAKGKLVYRRLPMAGTGDEKTPIVFFDFEAREEKTVLDDADGFDLSHDGNKLLVLNERRFAMVDLKPTQKFEKPLRVAEMEAPVDPRAEWRQIFNDAYRFERDFFYDPNMHGVDWKAMRDHYGKLVDGAVSRYDLNWILGEFIGELNASHTYRGGGDVEQAAQRNTGMLGVDWALEHGAYRIKRFVGGGAWDVDVRSPLAEPGLDVKEGDYVLAVNGIPVDTAKDPWAAFSGLGNTAVQLTVNDKPAMEGARQVVVQTITNETELRFRDWIEARRKRVDEATGGKVGYIYVQSTGVDAQNELVRQFMAQWRKDGLIIDERFNSGGQIPDRFIELLNRPMLSYWATRHGEEANWPPVAHNGPKVMLINGWSGSGGDAFPYYFREAKVGPLIGKRTWGGLIGISGAPALVDGGTVTVPTFRMYGVDGKWFAEGHGVEPDIEVEEDPSQLAKGVDPQLERAIEEVMTQLKSHPVTRPARPQYENRTPKGKGTTTKTTTLPRGQ